MKDNQSGGLGSGQRKMIENQKEIKESLDAQYDYLINLPDNAKIKDEIIDAVKELTEQQSKEISDEIIRVIHADVDRLDHNLLAVYHDLKNTDDVQMKMKLGIPLLNVIGLNVETEFDVKSWAKKMYEKHKVKVFDLMGYL